MQKECAESIAPIRTQIVFSDYDITVDGKTHSICYFEERQDAEGEKRESNCEYEIRDFNQLGIHLLSNSIQDFKVSKSLEFIETFKRQFHHIGQFPDMVRGFFILILREV